MKIKSEFIPKDELIPIKFKKGKKQVFVDWWFVEPGYGMPFWPFYQEKYGTDPWLSPYGVELKICKPEIVNTPISTEDPLGHLGAYCTLMYDTVDGKSKYRLWYETYGFEAKGDEGAKICYMESKDCVEWTKPELNLISYNGSKSNNIVYGYGDDETGGSTGGHGATVIKDIFASPEKRYKLVYIGPAGDKKSRLSGWLYGAVSPDGIRWKKLAEPVLKYMSDTQTILSIDRSTRKYYVYLRGWSPQLPLGLGGRRFIRRAETKDFTSFGKPVTVLKLNYNVDPSADIYTNSYHPWPHADRAHLMMPSIYHRDRDTLDLYYAFSRDGLDWSFHEKESIIPSLGDMGSNTVCAGKGLAPYSGGKWAFPLYMADKCHNEYAPSKRGLYLATVREDGFMAIEALTKGEFYTFPVKFEGKNMLLNSYSYPGGEITIEFLAVKNLAEASPVKGFTIDECDPVRGNPIWTTVSWNGKDNLSSLRGKTVRIRFRLIRSRIYGFKFE